jgi:hypothetical protein
MAVLEFILYDYSLSDSTYSIILDSHPNDLDFIEILTHLFLKISKFNKLLRFFFIWILKAR